MAEVQQQGVQYPRVAITYSYFGQELLSTFGTSIGEIALIPATGGTFTVYLTYKPLTDASENVQPQQVLIWDRKTDGGFPEAKILKQRIRNHIEPDKKLGHSDTPSSKVKANTTLEGDIVVKDSGPVQPPADSTTATEKSSKECEDCA